MLSLWFYERASFLPATLTGFDRKRQKLNMPYISQYNFKSAAKFPFLIMFPFMPIFSPFAARAYLNPNLHCILWFTLHFPLLRCIASFGLPINLLVLFLLLFKRIYINTFDFKTDYNIHLNKCKNVFLSIYKLNSPHSCSKMQI